MAGDCFREWARLMEGKSDHLLEDAMIAATARGHALIGAKLLQSGANGLADFEHG